MAASCFAFGLFAFVLLSGVFFSSPAQGAKIAAIGYPLAYSHHSQLMKIGEELTSRGHEFSLILSEIDFNFAKNKINFPASKVKIVTFQTAFPEEARNDFVFALGQADPLSGLGMLGNMTLHFCKDMIKNEEVMDTLKAVDLHFQDHCVICAGFVHDLLKLPKIVHYGPVSFMDPFLSAPYGINTLFTVSYIPQVGTHLNPNMGFGGRVKNFLLWGVNEIVRTYKSDGPFDELRAQYGLRKSIDLFKDVGIVLIQSSWAIEFSRPVPPTIKLVGPVTASPAKPLPESYEKWLQEAGPEGVILVSFGSVASPDVDVLDKLMDGFSRLKCRVLWKLNFVVPTKTAANVRIESWVPQNDILAHPQTKAFLSHGGLNSVQEASYHGVPLIGFPMFADQFDNVQKAAFHGMAIVIDKDSFTPESLASDIEGVIATPSYKASAARISAIIQGEAKERSPVARVADWVEHALKHDGATYLRPKSLDLPFYALMSLDVMLFIVVVVVIAPLVCCKYLCCRRKANKTASEKKNN